MGIAQKFVKILNKLLCGALFFANLRVILICMIPDFKVSFDGSDRTEVLRPILHLIAVEDKPGVDADSATIVLKATQQLIIPDSGTDVAVSLGIVAEIKDEFNNVRCGCGVFEFSESCISILRIFVLCVFINFERITSVSTSFAW